jgi:hypothetical protein
MATILLSAVGAAVGAGFGGTVLGLSGAVIGRAVGATIGRSIDQRVLAGGSEPVEVGRVERFRLTGASEGAAIPRHWGRMRVGGQVIWSTQFNETATTTGGGKGAPAPKSTSFAYTVSLAVALCEGIATSVGRVWADGQEIAPDSLGLRFYPGDEVQLPDAKIEAVEGAGLAPAYRGIAYVVIEDLDLGRFGNRVPQFTFEVMRRAQGERPAEFGDLADSVRAVALIPGTGEYALATTPVHVTDGLGVNTSRNIHAVSGKTDLAVSLDQLRAELPRVGSVSLVVSWFGDDLRCAECEIRPKVEQVLQEGVGMEWTVSGATRSTAAAVPDLSGRPVYGGTPTDQSVVEAIQAIKAGGQEVMFYPFILMDQLEDNLLPDPWTGEAGQPVLPWRGRITLSAAPGQDGSPDGTTAAADEVAAFLGAASPADFTPGLGTVGYSGPAEWSYRRFILHYAHLCALAGGVDAFCIGSEMRSLTQVRGAGRAHPMVAGLVQLAAEVRAILGPDAKISYAADWSEYFGHHVGEDVHFHLDPLWADDNIDFVGIDNYMPVSDWREGEGHADAAYGSIYNIDYLKANIAGGEGFDWYYDGPEGEAAQQREPITDGAYDEPWVFRYKDLRSWWSNYHFDRVGGVREGVPTLWEPGMKPIRFTEYGCAAIDKGTNQPNLFLDPKSSESALPRTSNGRRDDFIQMQYLRAMAEFWDEPANNPDATAYAGPMLDFDHSHVWAWDARPFPAFPGATELWSDGDNFQRGHWLNGRSTGVPLAGLVADVCERAGLAVFDASPAYGLVRGYTAAEVASARSVLQPLATAFGMDGVERDGMLSFRIRDGRSVAVLDPERLARAPDLDEALELTRAATAELAGTVRVSFVEAEGDFHIRTAETIFPDDGSAAVSQSDLPLMLTAPEARALAERWLAEARVGQDGARFALPRSRIDIGPGDVVTLAGLRYRVDRSEAGELQLLDAVRVDPGAYVPGSFIEDAPARLAHTPPTPVFPLFLDLPLLTGQEVPHAPHVAVTATPWLGQVAVWSSAIDDGYTLNTALDLRAVIGLTETALPAAAPAVWDRGEALQVRIAAGQMASATVLSVLNGANAAAIGDGTPGNWEVIQFETAELIAPNLYAIRNRLRGQAGTDGVMPESWPVGSYFVLLDAAVPQIALQATERGLERFYRTGLSSLGYADPTVVVQQLAFDGIGLRPYSVAHLAAEGSAGSDVTLTWLRRTRIDGDSWASVEVPLGEASERYAVRVLSGSTELRALEVTSPGWTYSAAMQAADGAASGFAVSVAQLSEAFGPGPAQLVVVA